MSFKGFPVVRSLVTALAPFSFSLRGLFYYTPLRKKEYRFFAEKQNFLVSLARRASLLAQKARETARKVFGRQRAEVFGVCKKATI